MYSLVEIATGTVPFEGGKLYPEYQVQEGIVMYETPVYKLRLDSFVQFERDGDKYLVYFSRVYEEKSPTKDINDHIQTKLKWTSWANDECDRISKYFIIPDLKDFAKPDSSMIIPIYKYKKNV